MQRINAAVVQFNHAPGDKAGNMATIRSFIDDAARQQVDLLVFPEMCVTGYWHVRKLSRAQIEALAEPVPAGDTTQELLAISAQTGMTIGAGLIEAADDGQLYNTCIVAMPDGRVAFHRKIHCFISEHMASGDRYTVFDIPQGARVGVLICYDNNIGENVRATALQGAEILLAPHQTGGCDSPSPKCMGRIDPQLWHARDKNPHAIEAEFRGPKGQAWLMRWLPARAHDNGMFLLFANGVGVDDDEVRTGNAMILGPYGEVLAETCAPRDEMLVTELDPNLLHMSTGQRWIRTRRPALYGPLTESTGRERDTRSVRFARKPANADT
ncbi:MAG: nitrilase family protein [Phycisphaeraceae bacterium]|jgi:predicted amidohydrolase|nr:nitrilase family protein [Phycisphaeraceae bacterium]MDP7347237.1 nitrilase family protein [Phycisphaeraceae bacterium]